MEIFTVAELARYLNTSSSTIRRLIKEGEIPYFKVRGIIKFNKISIDSWIKNLENKNFDNAIQGGNIDESKTI